MPSARNAKPKRQVQTQPYKKTRGRRARDEAVRDGLGANMKEIYELVQTPEKKQPSRTNKAVDENIDAAVAKLLVL